MALTTAQLVAQYTNANLGKAPDAATALLLEAYASQTQTGALTDGQATSKIIDLVDKTTSVAVATYQFFTGKTPSSAGLAFLVNSDDATGNKTDLNDGYYAKFATENRYINFAVNLGADPASEANASFKANYGTLTFRQVVEVVYEKVIGTAAAQSAGINVPAAIDFLARAENEAYLKAFVKQYAPGVDQDLGVKAALIGTIINAGLAANVGSYASSTEKLIQDLADDGKTASTAAVDLLVAYPPTQVVPPTKTLTANVDTLVGTGSAEFFAGVVGGANATFTALDTIDGGGGIDTLTLVDGNSGTAFADQAGVTVKNIEVLNFTSATSAIIDTTGTSLSGVGTVNANGASADATVTSTQAVSATASNGAATVSGGTTQTATATDGNVLATGGAATTTQNLTVTNGSVTASKATGAITVNATKMASSTINDGTSVTATVATTTDAQTLKIGGTTAPTGAVNVSVNSALAAKGTGIATEVTGGSSVTVTSTASNTLKAGGDTTTQGSITVTATADTKSVTLTQAAAVKAVAEVKAVAGATEVATVKFTDLADKGTIILGGVTFTNSSGATIKAADVATAFANLTDGSGGAKDGGDFNGKAFVKDGALTGTLTGWTTSAATKDTVTFTSSSANTDIKTDLAATGSGTATVTTTTQGITTVDAVAAVGGVAAGAVTITDAKAAVASVSITNAAAVSITGDALTSLALAGTVDATTITNKAAAGKSDALALSLTDATVKSLDDGTHYTSLAVTTAGAKASSVDVAAVDGVTALTVTGTQALTLTGVMDALKTATVSGAVGVTANFTGTKVTSVDASASTGKNTVSIDGTAATYKGGSGVDTVTVTAAPTKSIDGGAGSGDVFVYNSKLAYAVNASVTGFETLALGGDADAVTYDATGFTGLSVGAVKGAAEFTNVAAGTGLTVTASTGSTVKYSLKDATGKADSLGLTVTGSTGVAAAVDATGIETISITSVNTATKGAVQHTVTLTAPDATSITLTGSGGVDLGSGVKAKNVDASGLTGVFTYTANDAGATVSSGSAKDAITLDAANLTVTSGSGDDTITVNGTAALATITTGAGADVINIKGPAVNLNSYVTITDFGAGDVLSFNGIATTANESFASTKLSLAPTASFQDYADAAIAAGGDGTARAGIGWFQFGGDTYVIVSQHNGGTTPTFQNGTDIAVKLTGLIDLSTSFNDLGLGTATAGVAEFRG